MSGLLQQLQRFAGKKPWQTAPFSLKIDKTPWTVGTDGMVLFAVKMGGGKTRKDLPEELPGFLTSAPITPVEIDVPLLKEWAGPVPAAAVLMGEVDAEHQGVLLGHAIDRRKLAYLMAGVSLPKLNCWVVQKGLLAFEHPQRQWRALLAGLSEPPEGDEPVFNTTSDQAAVLAELLEQEAATEPPKPVTLTEPSKPAAPAPVKTVDEVSVLDLIADLDTE